MVDHVQELHKQLCQLQLRFHRLERERNEQSNRIQELEQLLNGYEGDDPQEILLTQSLQLADALNSIDALKSKVCSLTEENEVLKQNPEVLENRTLPQRQSSFQMLRRRGQSFRGILPSSMGSENERNPLSRSKSLTVSQGQHHKSDATNSETRRLAELHRTIMEKQIEALEEERNDYRQKCQSQASIISKLRDEQKLQAIKIEMLEQVVRSMNNSNTKDGDANVSLVSDEVSSSFPALKRSQSLKPSLSTSTTTITPLQSNTNRLNRTSSTSRRKIQVIVNGEPAWYIGMVNEADGSPHGTGTIRFSNGDKYFGELQHGEMHGQGTLYCSDSNEMKRGRFEHDAFLGR